MRIDKTKLEWLMIEAGTSAARLAGAMGCSPQALSHHLIRVDEGEPIKPWIAGKMIRGFQKIIGRKIDPNELVLIEPPALGGGSENGMKGNENGKEKGTRTGEGFERGGRTVRSGGGEGNARKDAADSGGDYRRAAGKGRGC